MIAAHDLKQHAYALGFNVVGLIPAHPSPRLDAFLRWLEQGMHGMMGYLARADRTARRVDLNVILPGVRSMIVVGVDYGGDPLPAAITADPSRGRIARYAWGQDYHDVLTPRLEALAMWLRRNAHAPVAHRAYVDTGAVLERSHAQQAGLGFVGKNTMLIHPRRGSYSLLGELLTDATFDTYDEPHRETMCGSCNRCRVACPTEAFPDPYVLDARRCISYLTIEYKGWINAALRPLMGNWVMGCDVCQEVCPFTRFAPAATDSAFAQPDLDRIAPLLSDLLRLDEAAFLTRFGGSPVSRLKRERLVRNACVAAGNWGSAEVADPLIALLSDPSPLVRGHAAWALGQIGGERASAALTVRRNHEPDPLVRGEIASALDGLR
jgi:epoxyqueuosine reductase